MGIPGMLKLSYDAMIGVPDNFWRGQGEVTAKRLLGVEGRAWMKFIPMPYLESGIVAPFKKGGRQ